MPLQKLSEVRIKTRGGGASSRGLESSIFWIHYARFQAPAARSTASCLDFLYTHLIMNRKFEFLRSSELIERFSVLNKFSCVFTCGFLYHSDHLFCWNLAKVWLRVRLRTTRIIDLSPSLSQRISASFFVTVCFQKDFLLSISSHVYSLTTCDFLSHSDNQFCWILAMIRLRVFRGKGRLSVSYASSRGNSLYAAWTKSSREFWGYESW